MERTGLTSQKVGDVINERLYRDPVHNIIALDCNNPDDLILMRLIDTPEMQRLRRVRQLGLASYAYQGAEHSRFTHSIGVMWIATRILARLMQERSVSPRLALATRCAALLHDVGHGPLSHIFESVLGVHHEEWTQRILLNRSSPINAILREASPSLPRMVVDVIEGRGNPPFLSQIISSQLDADRFDYLLRDGLMTGVKYGIYDLERILHILRLDKAGRHIVIAANGVMPVEKYLQSRYSMYLQVYLHKTVRASETMLSRLLLRAGDLARQNKLPLPTDSEPLTRMLRDGTQASLADFLIVDDDSVYSHMKHWSNSPDPILQDFSRRLLERRLFKTIDITQIRGLRRKLQLARSTLRDAGLDPRYYFIVDESTNVPYRPYDAQSPESTRHILVEDNKHPKGTRDLHEVSEVVRGLTRAAFTIRRAIFPSDVAGFNLREKMDEIFSE